MGHSPWSHKESDMTEQLTLSLSFYICIYVYVSACHTVLSILHLLNVHVVKCTFNVYNNTLRTVLLPSFTNLATKISEPLRDVEKFACSHPKKR